MKVRAQLADERPLRRGEGAVAGVDPLVRRARGLVEQVLTEPGAPQARTAVYDGLEYELTVTCAGAPDQRIHTRDGALTPAQRALIGELRPHLHPF